MRAINRKILLLYGIVAFLILSLALLCALCVDKSVTASASSPQKFSPQMNSVYTHYLDGAVDWQQKNQCSAWGIKHSEAGGVTYAQVYMQKSNGTTGNIAPAGDYGIGLRYQDIVITIFAGDLKHSISLYDGSGTLIKHETENDSINVTLDQGKYQFFVIMETGTWKRKSDGKMEKYRLEAEFTFYIDQTSPYIIGTYPEGGEKWVGINHVVEAKDDLSGVDDFYYIDPDEKFFRFDKNTRSYTFQEGDKEGLYKFYAYDNAGNNVLNQGVLFDATAPEGTVSLKDGTILENGGEASQPFSFSAIDLLSGISTIECKAPSSDWRQYTSGTLIENPEEGDYMFRTTDAVGNTSIYTVTVSDPCIAGHVYHSVITYPTCTSGGYTMYTCSVCGESYKDNEIAPTGHSYDTSIVEATCTEQGYTIFTCTRCGDCYQSSQTEPLGHAYVTEKVSATCEEGGYTKHTCSRCGDSYADNQSQPLGHNYIMVIKEASCTEFGMTVYTCQVCGYEHTEENGAYPTGHNYSNFIVKAATCTEDGERRYVCDKCGDEYTEVIAATGHSYAITDSTSKSGKMTRVYTCTICGDSYTQELGDQYDEVTSYVEDLFEQYRPYMVWVFLATAAIWSIVMGVFFAIAHKNEDKEKARKMIVNYFVGLIVIFAILVACPYLIRGIAALVT